MVLADELAADGSELRPKERFPSGEIEVLNPAEGSRKGEQFLGAEIVTPVQVALVKAVFALLIANGIYE